jgi:diguanylate cyclase (GGDEF)-like protein
MDQRDELILQVAARVRRGLRRDASSGLLVFSDEGFVEGIDASLADLAAASVPVSLIFADLDRFAEVNAAHGRRAGDDVLAAVGSTLRDLVRPLDLVMAGGGDAFVLALFGAALDVAVARAEVARRRLAELELPGAPHGVTASFGVVTHDGDEAAVDLVDRGFEAEFRAKALGRDRVEVAA